MSARRPLPRWADVALLPFLNLLLAMIVSGIVIALIGQNPLRAIQIMAYGAFGYGEGIGYTLHFATTDFVFYLALPVALAAHAGLFNIGAEGQAYLAGLGAIFVGLTLDHTSWLLVLPLAIVASAAIGATLSFHPGYSAGRRAAAMMVHHHDHVQFHRLGDQVIYLLGATSVLKPKGVQEPRASGNSHGGRQDPAASASSSWSSMLTRR